MNNYYYLLSGLPTLNFPQDSWKNEVKDVLAQIMTNVDGFDHRLVKYMIYPNDNQNLLRAVFLNKKLKHHFHRWFSPSVFPVDVMENYQQHLDQLPAYMLDFIEYTSQNELSSSEHERLLLEYFYREVIHCGDDFTEKYYQFELNLKKITAALNGRYFDLDFRRELIGDDDINQSLVRSSAADFGIGQYFPFLDRLNEAFENGDPGQLERMTDQVLWDFIDELTRFSFFNTHQVLGYAKKLLIVNRWMQMTADVGSQRLEELVDGIMNEFTLPKLN